MSDTSTMTSDQLKIHKMKTCGFTDQTNEFAVTLFKKRKEPELEPLLAALESGGCLN